MNDFDEALRQAIEKQASNQHVVFIQKDVDNQIIPCSPNKILLSKITSLQPHKRLLPVGMQTYSKTRITRQVNNIDEKINNLIGEDTETLIDLEDATQLIEMIYETYDPEKGETWDVTSFLASLEFLSHHSSSAKNKVWLIVRTNRNMSRIRESSQKYEDAPDTSRGKNSELKIARQLAQDTPALILLRENGSEEQGWRNSPFWWSVLVTPAETPPVVFAGETMDR